MYADKILSKNLEEKAVKITTHSILSSDDAESNWDLQCNATNNSSVIFTLHVLWKSRKDILKEYSEMNKISTILNVSDITKYMVSLEIPAAQLEVTL